jgi:hypothetical protein
LLPNGNYQIVVCDAKSRVSTNQFGEAPSTLKATWRNAVADALSPARLDLGNPGLEQAIRDAWAQGRVRIVRDTIDFSASGQGGVRLDN